MPNIFIGAEQIKNIWVGTEQIKRVWIGTDLVYSKQGKLYLIRDGVIQDGILQNLVKATSSNYIPWNSTYANAKYETDSAPAKEGTIGLYCYGSGTNATRTIYTFFPFNNSKLSEVLSYSKLFVSGYRNSENYDDNCKLYFGILNNDSTAQYGVDKMIVDTTKSDYGISIPKAVSDTSPITYEADITGTATNASLSFFFASNRSGRKLFYIKDVWVE